MTNELTTFEVHKTLSSIANAALHAGWLYVSVTYCRSSKRPDGETVPSAHIALRKSDKHRQYTYFMLTDGSLGTYKSYTNLCNMAKRNKLLAPDCEAIN